jgi:peptidoglycan biosynthesis protein MviN/MurJ (putative lipid II flippase)
MHVGRSLFASWGLPAIYALAAGVMLGGALQLTVQLVALRQLGLLPHIGVGWQSLVESSYARVPSASYVLWHLPCWGWVLHKSHC